MAEVEKGCVRFECKSADNLVKPFRSRPHNVAAIDFGTANCSLMYLLAVDKMKQPEKAEPTRLKFDGYYRVPNCALFDSSGIMTAFGFRAQRRYYKSISREELTQAYFFRNIKMSLQHDETVSRSTTVKAVNGAEFYLVDVIAHILKWMKEKLMQHEAQRHMEATDFDWVITVPAMWRARGKQMMREAGYKAGLCSVNEPQPIYQVCNDEPHVIVEPNTDRLTLALEPECATLRCRQAVGFEKEECYIVVDIGGGTVDIVSHAIVEGHLEELRPPKGNAWGGITVNETFRNVLGDALGDPNFSRYIGPDVPKDKRAANERDLEYIIYKEFEEIKQDFGAEEESTEPFVIQLPQSFWDKYMENMKVEEKRGISFNLDMHELAICGTKMAELFEPTIQGIVSIMTDVLQEIRVIENVYFAGGFGGCPYVKLRLQSALRDIQQALQLHHPPGEPELCVVHGAVVFRCSPSIIHKRKADATYGLDCAVPFQLGIHEESKKKWYEDQNEHYCRNIFCTIVEEGESISSGTVYVKTFSTLEANQKTYFKVYSSTKKDVWYTTDPHAQQLGHFHFDLPGVNQEMEVAFDFTHAEIQVRVYDKENPVNETKTVVDFL